ncbi:hypothetical protein LTR28_003577 [Elasticomyces elasticus]|nr:hypothetical protein LTR28_003577 [Elasticomyces elasticus]
MDVDRLTSTESTHARGDKEAVEASGAVANDVSHEPLAASWRAEPLSAAETSKVVQILEACRDHDLPALAALATSDGGLVEDEIRRIAWPLLLGCGDGGGSTSQPSWQTLPAHRDEHQVELDVNRSFIYYPKGESETQIDSRKQQLSNVITEVLRRHPLLCYFQGYHDIVQVLLLVLGAEKAVDAVAHLSLLRIRDFMLPSLSAAISHLQLLPAIMYAADAELCKHLSQTMKQPFFALAATLTMYAHDIQEYGDIARLFDFLLAREAVFSVYLFAVVITSRKKDLLSIPPTEPETLHSILSSLPRPLDLDPLLARTTPLFAQHPPASLPFRAWSRISRHSVLKTTRDAARLARLSLQDGEALFRRQAAEMERVEAWERRRGWVRAFARRYRREVVGVGGAVLVALVAVWLGSGGVERVVGEGVAGIVRWVGGAVGE